MRVASSLCLLLLPLVQGLTMVSLTTEIVKPPPPYHYTNEIDFVDPATGECTEFFDLDDDILVGEAVLLDSNTLLYDTTDNNANAYLNTIDLKTKKTKKSHAIPRFFFTGLAFDKVTNQTFVAGYNYSAKSSLMYERLPDQSLRQFADMPWEINADTYSSSKHVFFFGVDQKTKSSRLVTVGTVGAQEGKVLHNVAVAFNIVSLAYSEAKGLLYAWGSTTTGLGCTLYTLDPTTGAFTPVLSNPFDFYAGPMAVDAEGKFLYNFLYDPDRGKAVIVKVDLDKATASQPVSTDSFLSTMSLLE